MDFFRYHAHQTCSTLRQERYESAAAHAICDDGSSAYRDGHLITIYDVGIKISIASIIQLTYHNPSLYSLAIQRALALLLSTKLSLYQLYLGYNIAKPSSIINIKRPVWMIASIVCVVAVSAQTAGYDIFITSILVTG